MWNIVHNNNKDLVLVGRTANHLYLQNELNPIIPTKVYSIEYIKQQSQEWIKNHQFFCGVATVTWKHYISKELNNLGCDLCSIVHESNVVRDDWVKIGKSVYIEYQNCFYGPGEIKDYCSITSQVQVGHEVYFGFGCHIAGQTFFNYSNIGNFSVVGVASKICGKAGKMINIPNKTNIMLGSVITRSLPANGTYLNRELKYTDNSFEKDILK